MSDQDGGSEGVTTKNLKSGRVVLSGQELERLGSPELLSRWKQQDSYVTSLEERLAQQEGELAALRDSEERLRALYVDSQQREKVLVRRLAAKEQEMQDYVCQLAELKASQGPNSAALRSSTLDPAVNVLLQLLRQELVATRTRLEETQNELSAWKFTPDSNTGKRLMAKCRLLYQENEELGKMTSNGRLAKLEGELALQKSFSEEVKKSQMELDEFLQDLDEDVEGMQSTIYYLQQELRKSQELVVALQSENGQLRSVRVNGSAHPAACNDTRTDSPSDCSEPAAAGTTAVSVPDSAAAAKRVQYDSDSSTQEHRTRNKKVRRSSVLSLDYNEDDALVISTNGDVAMSDAE